MGTSASHPGSGPGSPLVPPWADAGGPQPIPPAPERRFQAFRRQLGLFAATGSEPHLRTALKHFASTSLGGSKVGVRRFGSMSRAGAAMFGAFTAPGGVAAALSRAGVDLDGLRGASLDTVIEAIARAFTPDDGDRDITEAALFDALAEALKGEDEFDPETFAGFSEEVYVKMMTDFITSCVFRLVLVESATALDKAPTDREQVDRENQIMLTVSAAVQNAMVPLVQQGITTITEPVMRALELECVGEVLRAWEGYDG